MIDELPIESEMEFVDNRPIVEKIGDKNWKSRMSAYEDLRKALLIAKESKDTAGLCAEYAPWLPKMTADINAGALDMGIDIALLFVDAAPDGMCQPYHDKLFGNVVDKTFSGRASTATKGKALLLKLIEVEDGTACTQYLLTRLGDKKPKIPATSLDVIREGMELFGVRAFPVKEILKALPSAFNSTIGATRDATMSLLVELYRWIGQAPLQALVDGLRTAQKSDFEKIIAEKAESFGPLLPKLYLRKDRPAEGTVVDPEDGKAGRPAPGGATAGQIGRGAPHGSSCSDGREYVEEVDLPKKLKSTEYLSLLADEKWSEQLKGLQLVIDAIGPLPKIRPDCDVQDILSAAKGFLRQGHLQVQVSSLRILALLADGMRASFGSSVRPLMQQIVSKCKEKRLVPEVQALLTSVFTHCLGYDCINDDVIEFVSSKKSPPHGKIGLMETALRTLQTLPDKVSSDCLKPLAVALIGETEDSDPKVRESSCSTLAALAAVAKSRGRLAADAYKAVMATEHSAPKVFKKIQLLLEKSPGEAASSSSDAARPLSEATKPKAASASSSSAALPAPAAKKLPTSSSIPGSSSTAAVGNNSKKTTSAAAQSGSTAPTANAKKASSNISSAAAADDDNVDDLALSEEDATVQLEGMQIRGWAEGTVQAAMAGSKWQEKVDALAAIEQRLVELQEGGLYSAALVRYLSATSSGFKISHVNILKATISTCCAAAAHVGSQSNFSRPAAWELLRQFGDKLSDKKTKDGVQMLLSALARCLGGGFVVKRMKVVMDKSKAPLVHQHYLEWLKDAVMELGSASFPVPFLCAFLQSEMDNKAVAVRSAAVEAMGALYSFIGPRLSAIAFSDDMKPQVRSLIEAEFSKVGFDPAKAAASSGAVDGSGAGSAGIPRQDLSAMLDKNIVSELGFVDGKTSWQRRKAALESIVSCCDRSSHFLDANKATSEILKALKPRMSDTQANLKPLAVSAIGHIVASLDAETSGVKVLRVMAPIMMLGLGDNKKAMRDATIVALHHAVTTQLQPEVSSPTAAAPLSVAKANSSMMSSLLPAVIEVLANPVGRQEILEWFLLHIESLKGDWTEIASPLVITIQDKSAAVRQAGEQLLTALLAASLVSRTTLDKATRDLPPATKRAMQAAIDRMMSAAGTGKLSATSSSMESLKVSQELTKAPAQGIPRSASSHSQTPFTSPPRMMMAAEPTATTAATSLPVPVVRRSGILQPKSTSSASTHSDEQAAAALHHKSTPASTIKASSHSSRAGAGGTPSPGSASKWLLKRNAAGKLRRPDEGHQSWPQPPELPGEAEMTALKAIWKPLVTPDLLYLLFPTSNTPSKQQHGLSFNQDSFVPALNELTTQLECPHLTHHTEYILRWSCVVLSLKLESSSGLYKLLQFLCEVFQAISAVETGANILTDGEASYIIPHLIDRAGHRSERHQAMFRKAISIASSIMSTSKLAIMLIRSLKSPNKRTRVICLEEVRVLVEGCSAASIIGVIGHSAVNQMALLLDAKDCDVACRNACLETICAVFFCLGRDFNAMKRLIGNDVSDQSLVLIEERIELKSKQQSSDGGSCSVLRTDSNRDDDSTTRSDSCNTLSPNSEMRSHRMLLDQIDAVMASTPLPANRTRVAAVTSPAAAADASRSPPAIHTPTAGNGRTLNNEQSPVPMPITVELESIYLEIEAKIDSLLQSSSSSSSSSRQPSSQLQDECKDYLKMLHSIVSGDWSAEKLPEDDSVLQKHAEALIGRLVRCVARSFRKPNPPPHHHPSGRLSEGEDNAEVDISLLAISLSTLFAFVKRSDVVSQLSEAVLFEVFHECLHRICDDRLAALQSSPPSLTSNEVAETAQQIVRAFNMVVLRLGVDGPVGAVLAALIRVMFCCIPANELQSKQYPDHRPLLSSSTKPTSRLIIQVLSEQSNKLQPYSDSDLSLRQLLDVIHVFFTQHPTSTVDDTPFRTVKTILNELIRIRGGYTILGKLQETASIPRTAFIYLLTCRLGNVKMQETDTVLHAKLVAVIDDITSSRDKLGAIRELHRLKQSNPLVDINQYLQKISTAFRRYVLNTLAKLDSIDCDGADLENQSFQSNTPAATTEGDEMMKSKLLRQQQQQLASVQASLSSTTRVPTKLTSPPSSSSEPASFHSDPPTGPTTSGKVKRFAFNPQSKRMEMEVLDSPPKQVMESQDRLQPQQMSPSMDPASSSSFVAHSRAEASPFARRNDVIRSSLSHLSAALTTLELPAHSPPGLEDSNSRAYLEKDATLSTY